MSFSKSKSDYTLKLRDPRWQRKRSQIISRDEGRCLGCGVMEGLEVHHRWYERGKEPWDYDDECYETLCDDCHDCLHKRVSDRKRVEIGRGVY